MNVPVTFTLNEMQRITPSLTLEHIKSELPHVKEILKDLFFRLDCTLPDKVEIAEGVVSLNRFGEEDLSPRITVHERLDEEYIQSGRASHQAKVATKDIEMMKDLDNIRNLRCMQSNGE